MENNKNSKILKIIGAAGLFLIAFGLSYALFSVTLNGTKKAKISTGRLELQLLDKNNNPIYITDQNTTTSYEINLNNQAPISDEEGLNSTAFEFKLKNSGNISAKYTIYLDDGALDDGENRIDDKYIKYSLTKNGSNGVAEDLISIGANPNRKLDSGAINNNAINTYTLKVWISKDADNDAIDKVFNVTLRVEGTQYESPFESNSFANQLYAKDNVGILDKAVQNGFRQYTDEESGLYKYTDNKNTTTYVYRGLPEDNYISLANELWRIYRINTDGSIKLIKEDALYYTNDNYYDMRTEGGVTMTTWWFNSNSNWKNEGANKYAGSSIEQHLNNWYEDILKNNYDNKIKEEVYCSERYETERIEPIYSSNHTFNNWVHVYGIWNRGYKATDTIHYYWEPNITCTENDEVSAKIALITADEYILAGGPGHFVGGETYNSYLKKGYNYFTMSPCGFSDYNGENWASVYMIIKTGLLNYAYSSNDEGVVPVITLNSNITITGGNGTKTNPYTIN